MGWRRGAVAACGGGGGRRDGHGGGVQRAWRRHAEGGRGRRAEARRRGWREEKVEVAARSGATVGGRRGAAEGWREEEMDAVARWGATVGRRDGAMGADVAGLGGGVKME
jgi:hypothetical protein